MRDCLLFVLEEIEMRIDPLWTIYLLLNWSLFWTKQATEYYIYRIMGGKTQNEASMHTIQNSSRVFLGKEIIFVF